MNSICLECGVKEHDHHLMKTHRFRNSFEAFDHFPTAPTFVPPKIENELDVCQICHTLRKDHKQPHPFQLDPQGKDDLCTCGLMRRCHAPFHPLVNHAFQYENTSSSTKERFCRTCGIPYSQHQGMVHTFR